MPTTTKITTRNAGIQSDAEFNRAVDDLAAVEVQLRALTAEQDAALQAVRDNYRDRIAALTDARNAKLSIVEDYASRHRDSLLRGSVKSAETAKARWGFRLGLPALALLSRRHTWRSVCTRLLDMGLSAYVKTAEPRPDKDRIKADLDDITLAAIGCRVEQTEAFWVEAKDQSDAL